MSEHKIPLSACQAGHAYLIHSRNLILGVFDGDKGFVGIREKFDSKFLFTEYHHDAGPPYGTVTPYREVGPCPIADLSEYHRVQWKGDGSDPEWAKPGESYYRTNQPLFDWLAAKEAELAQPCPGCGEKFWPLPWAPDPYCSRRLCWEARQRPCPTCGRGVTDSDGTQLCRRCSDPLAYDLMLIQAMERLDAERQRRSLKGETHG